MSETKRLESSSEIFTLNATGLSVDVYVNYEAQPTISDPKPLVGSFANSDELQPLVLVVNGETARPYGAYTFSVREKGDSLGPVLAAASIELTQGHSFSGVFHETNSGGYRFSIYENDLSSGHNARLTVRHTARPAEVEWLIRPNGEDPRVPPDHRSGILQNAQWQLATEVTDNDYVIEFFLDGARVALFADLDLAAGKNIIVHLIGDPQPTSDAELLLRPIVFQELEFDPGPAVGGATTAPAPPLSSSDRNATIEFDCGPVELWETDSASTSISALDPDGIVTSLSVDRVEPKVGGIEMLDHAFVPSPAIGEAASAELDFKSDIPAGVYTVSVLANRDSLAQKAKCAVELTVRPITIAQLETRVSEYQAAGDIEPDLADILRGLLDQAEHYIGRGDTEQACRSLKQLLDEVGREKGKAISDRAAHDLTDATKALNSDLGCG